MFILAFLACTDLGDGADDTSAEDTAPTEDAGFSEQSLLTHPQVDAETGECTIGYYWPALSTASPLIAVRYDAPEPPYEIRELSTVVFSNAPGAFRGQDCNASRKLRLFAFVDPAEDPTAYALSDGTWPTIPAVAEVEVSGAGDGVEWEGTEVLVGVLDPPVRVEDEGFLWIAYEAIDEDGSISCPMGCQDAGAVGWAYEPVDNDWGNEPGWSQNEETPDLRVLIGHN